MVGQSAACATSSRPDQRTKTVFREEPCIAQGSEPNLLIGGRSARGPLFQIGAPGAVWCQDPGVGPGETRTIPIARCLGCCGIMALLRRTERPVELVADTDSLSA